jgi:hypothetical protein
MKIRKSKLSNCLKTIIEDEDEHIEPVLPVEDIIVEETSEVTDEEKPNELNTETIISIDEISKTALEQENCCASFRRNYTNR